jgi:hypothetical protein
MSQRLDDPFANRHRLAEGATGVAEMEHAGFPAYTTSVGWLGYEKVRALAHEARAQVGPTSS